MKKSVKGFIAASVLFAFISCNNDKSAPASADQKMVDTSHKANVGTEPEGVNVSTRGSTSIDISTGDAKVVTKTGTNVQVNDKGVKVGTKNVNVNINTKKSGQ